MKTIEKILLLCYWIDDLLRRLLEQPDLGRPPRGWVQAKDDGAQSQHPTFKYVPSDGETPSC